MATKSYTIITLERLQKYDSLIKPFITGKVSDAVAKTFKAVSIDGFTLKFYTVEKPVADTTPAFTIDLPETDISGLISKIQNATAGDVVIANADGTVADGGVKLADLAKSADVTKEIGTAKTELESEIKVNTDAIAKLNGAEDAEGSVANAVKTAKDALQEQITSNKKVLDKLDGAVTVDGSVKKQIKDASDALDAKIGTLDNLTTTNKGNIVEALEEVKSAVGNAQTAGEVTVDTTTTTAGMAKSYTIKQGEKTVATIDIPKDMVVKSGTVEKDPKGQPAGTYLVLTLANATEDKVYVNVGTLIDIYTAKASATQVQIAIDSATREISATIVADSVTATELADAAVVTAKIADGNVTKAKLSKEVQTSLDKADTALQEADVATLRTDVADVKTSLAEGGATANAIAAAKKAGTDAAAAVDALEKGQVATNKTNIETNTSDITAIKGRLDTIEGVTYVEATDEQIAAMFTE